VGIHPIIKHTDTTLDKHVPIATNHNTTALLEKKNWVLSFLMICLLFPSSTPLAPSPKQLQPHKKKNKQTTRQITKTSFLNKSHHPG
jgi:hypothetical protein